MLDFLFGEGQYGLRFVFAIIVVFALLALTAWLVRRFGADRLGGGGARGRQPRLAVIDAAPVDGRRRLLLIRRDNVEHLVMIGGPTDVLVEANIVRAAAPAREATPARAPAGSDTLPRAVPLGESNLWPLQPQAEPRVEPRAEPQAPAPAPRNEPMIREPSLRAEPAHRPEPRPQRAPVLPEPQAEEEWAEEAEAPPPPPVAAPQRPARTADPIHGLAAELARFQAPPEPEAAPRPARQLTRAGPALAAPLPPPAPAPGVNDPDFNSNADQNLADMARSLEAAIRRPAKTEPRAAESPAPRPAPAPVLALPPAGEVHYDDEEAPAPAPAPAPVAAPQRALAPIPMEARPLRSDRPDPRAVPRRPLKPVGGKNPYDSLEQEMASLLGRPNKN